MSGLITRGVKRLAIQQDAPARSEHFNISQIKINQLIAVELNGGPGRNIARRIELSKLAGVINVIERDIRGNALTCGQHRVTDQK
jgi:hypothetical protein